MATNTVTVCNNCADNLPDGGVVTAMTVMYYLDGQVSTAHYCTPKCMRPALFSLGIIDTPDYPPPPAPIESPAPPPVIYERTPEANVPVLAAPSTTEVAPQPEPAPAALMDVPPPAPVTPME